MRTIDLLFRLLTADVLHQIHARISDGYSVEGAFASCGIDMRYYQLLSQSKHTDNRSAQLFNSLRAWREEYHARINRRVLNSKDMKALVQLKALDYQYGSMPNFDDSADMIDTAQWDEPVNLNLQSR